MSASAVGRVNLRSFGLVLDGFYSLQLLGEMTVLFGRRATETWLERVSLILRHHHCNYISPHRLISSLLCCRRLVVSGEAAAAERQGCLRI